MNLWTKLLHLLGLAEKEYHHIATNLQAAADDFIALEKRKVAEAEELAAKIDNMAYLKSQAIVIADRAKRSGEKIGDLFA